MAHMEAKETPDEEAEAHSPAFLKKAAKKAKKISAHGKHKKHTKKHGKKHAAQKKVVSK